MAANDHVLPAPPAPARLFARKIAAPLIVFIAALVADQDWHGLVRLFGLNAGTNASIYLHDAIGTVMWFSGGFLLHRLVVILFWQGWFHARTGSEAPKLLVDMTAVVIAVFAIGFALAYVYGVSPTGFLTTSGIVIAIVGFALRSMISDLFTGIALGVERPFAIGDWVEIEGGTVGKVVEMNWRATRLITRDDVSVVIPNSRLATLPFKNFSQPERCFRDRFDIVLDYDVTAYQAERLLLSAVNQIPEIAAINREATVRILEYMDRGVRWEVRYWVPDYPSRSKLRYQVKRNILRNLHYSSIAVPRAKIELTHNGRRRAFSAEEEDLNFFRQTDLLATLTSEEMTMLAANAERRLVMQGRPVVRQGDHSASLYIVREGLLDVAVADGRGGETLVGHLVPGSFFGEMSLLTGAPAGATVTPDVDSLVFVVTREYLEPVIRKRPELAQLMSQILASRQMLNARRLAEKDAATLERETASLTEQLVGRIRGFFGLGGGGRAKIPAE